MSDQYLEANKYLIRYYFIYKYKSFHKAAENFYIHSTDRNMRYAISQLEDFYGIQLVIVDGNKISFTEFGEILGQLSEQIYTTNVSIKGMIDRVNLKVIRFATSHDFYTFYIKPIFDVFQKENHDSTMILLKTNQYDATQRLLQREIDFIVGTKPVSVHPDLIYQKFGDARMLLAFRQQDEDKFKNITGLENLTKLRGGINDRSDPFYENLQKSLQQLNSEENNNDDNSEKISLHFAFETSDYSSLIDAVRSEFVDYAIVGNYHYYPDIGYLDISHLFLPVELAFIFRKGETPTKAIKQLIKISDDLRIHPIDSPDK